MDLLLVRGQPILPLAQPGELSTGGAHVCWTLENYPDRIPVGRYAITLYDSPHLGAKVPLLMNVPDREYIEIHWGTFPANYEGCIGVGETKDEATGDIFATRQMFNKLFPVIEAAVEAEGCWITVQ